MRLTPEAQEIIHAAVAETFGPAAEVWLFGSRVDDAKRGGDIDLLVRVSEPVTNPAWLAARLSARVSRQLHGRRVDVVLSAPNLEHLPIHDVALHEGRRLA